MTTMPPLTGNWE